MTIISCTMLTASAFALIGGARMMLAIHTNYWYNARHEEIAGMDKFDCEVFHQIQMRHKPILVQFNDWLVNHHV